MKTIKTDTVEYLILEDGEKLKQATLIARSGTGWQGQLFLESLKSMNGAWPSEKVDVNGNHVLRIPGVEEMVNRAANIVRMASDTMQANGWLVEMATAEDLLDQGGGRLGFMVNNDHGKADTGSPPLPTTK